MRGCCYVLVLRPQSWCLLERSYSVLSLLAGEKKGWVGQSRKWDWVSDRSCCDKEFRFYLGFSIWWWRVWRRRCIERFCIKEWQGQNYLLICSINFLLIGCLLRAKHYCWSWEYSVEWSSLHFGFQVLTSLKALQQGLRIDWKWPVETGSRDAREDSVVKYRWVIVPA